MHTGDFLPYLLSLKVAIGLLNLSRAQSRVSLTLVGTELSSLHGRHVEEKIREHTAEP